MSFFQLPSPTQQIQSSFLTEKGVEVHIKRDDLIHPEISGNKWRKLKFNLEEAKKQGIRKIVTFGGAFSNHIVATAVAGNLLGFKTIGVIRGERLDTLNESLKVCEENGMFLHFVSRADYKMKESRVMQDSLKDLFGLFYLIPEGGANELAVQGCAAIVDEISVDFDYISIAAGTGTTAAGVLHRIGKKKMLVFPALKGVDYLKSEILSYQLTREKESDLKFIDEYHFGGYAKVNSVLVEFTNQFYKEYSIKLDLVYTAKHFYGLFDLIAKDYFPKGTRIVAVHTGGLQGNKGMKKRYKLELFGS